MSKNDSLNIKITADPGKAEQGLKKLAEGIAQTGKAAKDSDGLMKGFGKELGILDITLAGLAANILSKGVGAIAQFGKQALAEAASFKKFGETVDMSAQEVAGIARTAEMSGASFESLQTAFQGINKALDPTNISENRNAIEKLGVSVKNSDGTLVSQKELLLRVSDAFASETDSAKKAALGMAAFGKSAGDLTPMLNQGRDALEKQFDTYGKASGYTDDFSATIEKLNGMMTEARHGALSLATAITDNFVFDAAVSGLKDLTKSFMEWRAASAGEKEKEKAQNLQSLAEATKEYYLAEQKGAETAAALNKQTEAGLKAFQNGAKDVDRLTAELNGMTAAYKELKKAGESAFTLDMQIRDQKALIKEKEAEIEAGKKSAKADEAGADAAKKAAETKLAALKSLSDQIKANYGTETEILKRAYDKDVAEYEKANKAKLISDEELEDAIKKRTDKYDNDIKSINDKKLSEEKKAQDEIIRLEKSTQEQIWRIKETYIADGETKKGIEIERIKAKYQEEIKLAGETGVAIADIKKAESAELKALDDKYRQEKAEAEKAAQELSWQLRETAAATEEERLGIQLERINARYDAEIEKARETGELLAEIEQARAAEVEATERRIQAARVESTSQYTNSMTTIAKSTATMGKASGNTMKAIATAEAIINSSLAFTKALASAPPPLNGILASAALASGMAQVAVIQRQKFAEGGIVGGNSYYGDKVPVSVNSGEMILNKEQQKRLFDKINGGGSSSGNQTIVNFSPNIAPSLNAEDVKKMIKENAAVFETFLARAVATGAGKTGVFV